ncbi:MAG: serine/threonine-protein kinase [Candidatus Krumholzibacteriota bacterium]|nr:serine/threonine-protein kinase [Candidatus Krumholzibacteriota bacterium]
MDQHNYRILNTIAKGGTSVLYKAVQTSLDRKVAVKKLHPELTSSPEVARRVDLCVKAAASLEHENIVRIIDSGTVKETYFIITEYIDGLSLRDLMRRNGRIDEKISLLITHRVCRGLDFAHRRGIIHRDIKPSNIMIKRDGSIKITDFGLAEFRNVRIDRASSETKLETSCLSLEPPIDEKPDNRNDIFSLGAVCYEMLTGKTPFPGNNYTSAAENIPASTPPIPSKNSSDISRNTDSIVMKAISRNPDNRFKSAGEMAEKIESLLSNKTILSSEAILKEYAFKERGAAVHESTKYKSKKKKALPLTIAAVIAGFVLIGFYPGIATKINTTVKRAIFQNPAPPSKEKLSGASNIAAGTQIKIFDAIRDNNKAKTDNTNSTKEEPLSTAVEKTAVNSDSPGNTNAVKMERNKTPEKITETNEAPPAAPANPTGFIDIHTRPEAAIFIDGKQEIFGSQLGPKSISAERHTILIRRADYRDYSEVITVKADELSKRRITLRKLTGKIEFSTQAGVKIFIAGKYTGTTPLSSPLVVESGEHRVKLVKKGYMRWENEVEVQAEETLRLKITLIPR